MASFAAVDVVMIEVDLLAVALERYSLRQSAMRPASKPEPRQEDNRRT